MDKDTIRQNLHSKMTGSLDVLKQELQGLRTGRASINLFNPVLVKAYDNKVPLSQIATLSTPDAKTITIQVWDRSMVKSVEKAIIDANLGLSPVSDGQLVRVTIPSLNEERRKDLVRLAHKYGEHSKIALRNIRRDSNEDLKKLEKDSLITKDEYYSFSEEVQKLTDEFSSKVDLYIRHKEQEILTV